MLLQTELTTFLAASSAKVALGTASGLSITVHLKTISQI